MRAAVLRNSGDELLEIVDGIESAPLGTTDVRVEIKATGVCHSDAHAMNGSLPQGVPVRARPRGCRASSPRSAPMSPAWPSATT